MLGRFLRELRGADRSGMLYGGAAAACAVAAGSLYASDQRERSRRDTLSEQLNARESRRWPTLHTVPPFS